MKQQQKPTVEANGNGNHKNGAKGPMTQRDTRSEMATEAELFLQLLKSIASGELRTQNREQEGQFEALNQIVADLEKALGATQERQIGLEKSVAHQRAQVTDESRKVHTEIEKRDGMVKELGIRIDAIKADFGKVVGVVLERVNATDTNVTAIADAQKDLMDRGVANQELIEQIGHVTSEQQRQIVKLANDQNDLKSLVDQRLEKTERRVVDLENLDQRFDRAELHLTKLSERTDRLQAKLDELAESLTTINVRLEEESRWEQQGVISKALRFLRLA